MSRDAGGSDDFELRDAFGNAEANLRFLRETGALTHGIRILEIGSGRGALLRHLLQQGHSARGVEVSADRIAKGRALYGKLPLVQVAGVALPFAEASFDVVLSFDVFEHIPDSDGHLREVHRVLTPNGRYLLQTPNKWTNSVFETIRWRSLSAWRVDHCALHTYGQLRRRLEHHGFDVQFHDVPVVTDYFRRKMAFYLGGAGSLVLKLVNPDRLPLHCRTNFYVDARAIR